MKSNVPRNLLDSLTVKELEDLLSLKKKNVRLSDLLRERDRLRLELRRIEDSIEAVERAGREGVAGRWPSAIEQPAVESSPDEHGDGAAAAGPAATPGGTASGGGTARSERPASFLRGKRRKNLKDYIAEVLLAAGEALSPSEIQRRLPAAGYSSSSTNPRSFYNTVFQALQRYEAFEKEGRKYRLTDRLLHDENPPTREILPKTKTRLKDFIVEVLAEASSPLKLSEIASRVVIAGYRTDLGIDDLTQRVSSTLKKYLNSDFEWDSQRYRLADRS